MICFALLNRSLHTWRHIVLCPDILPTRCRVPTSGETHIWAWVRELSRVQLRLERGANTAVHGAALDAQSKSQGERKSNPYFVSTPDHTTRNAHTFNWMYLFSGWMSDEKV